MKKKKSKSKRNWFKWRSLFRNKSVSSSRWKSIEKNVLMKLLNL